MDEIIHEADQRLLVQYLANRPNTVVLADIQKTKDAGKCPVCMVLPQPPTVLCNNGHIMCKYCVRTITRCPICNELFSNKIEPWSLKFMGLDNILGELPHISDSDMLNMHKYSREKRICKCQVTDCQRQFGFKDIKRHIENEHKQLLLTNNSIVSMKYEPNLKTVYPVLLKDLLIWKHVVIDPDKKTMFIFLECCAADSKQIKPILVHTVKGFKHNFKYTCTNYAYREIVDYNIASINAKSMAIPLYMLDHVKNEQDYIRYRFKIKKLGHTSLKNWNIFFLMFLLIITLGLFLKFDGIFVLVS